MYDCFTFDPIGITFTKNIKYSPLRDIQTHREQCQTQHYYIKIVILFTQKYLYNIFQKHYEVSDH